MKIIGRKVLAECEVGPAARKRLALWVKQLKEARWTSFANLRASHPDAKELGNSRFGFRFEDTGIEVEALASLELGIICIEKVVEQKRSTDEE